MESFHGASFLIRLVLAGWIISRSAEVTASGYSRGLRCRGESDLPPRRFWRRREQRQKFLVNVAQCGVMLEQRLVDFGQPLQNRSVRGELFSLLDERANDIHAHGDRSVTTQNIGRLQCAVLSKCPWAMSLPLAMWSQFATT